MRWTGYSFVALLAMLSCNTQDSLAQAKLSWFRLNHHGDSSDEIIDSSSSDNATGGEAAGLSSSDGMEEDLATSSNDDLAPISVLEEDLDVITVLSEEGASCTDGCMSVGLNCSEASLATGEETIFSTRSAFEDVLTALDVSCKLIVRGGNRRTAPYVHMPSGICHLNRQRGQRSRGRCGRCDASSPRQRRLCSCFEPKPVGPSEPCTAMELADVTTNFGEVDGLELQTSNHVHRPMTAEQCSEKLGTNQGDGTINYVAYSATEGCRAYLDFHTSSKAFHSDTSVTQAWACARSGADNETLSTVFDGTCINSGIQPGGPICFNSIEDVQDAMNSLNGSDAVIALCRSTPYPTFALNSSLSVPAGTSVRLCYAGMEGHATLAPSNVFVDKPLVEAVASPASFTLDRLLLSGGSPNVLIKAVVNATIRSSIIESGQRFGKRSPSRRLGAHQIGGENLVAMGPVGPLGSKLGKLVLEDTIIRNGSSSAMGAGAYIEGFASAEISRCSIYGNEVIGRNSVMGAGIAALNVDLVSIIDSSISNNKAEATARAYGTAFGGGIYIKSRAVINVTSSTFENNTVVASGQAGGAAGYVNSIGSQVNLSGNIGEGNIAELVVDDGCEWGSSCTCDGMYAPQLGMGGKRKLARLRGDAPSGPSNRKRRVAASCSGSDCRSVCSGCTEVREELSFNLDPPETTGGLRL